MAVALSGLITGGGDGGGGGGGPPPPTGFTVTSNALLTQGVFDNFNMVQCSPPITFTPSGGTPPYSLAWTLMSGAAFEVHAGSGPPWTTGFWFNSPNHFESVYRATVADSAGAVVTRDVLVIAN